MEFRLQAEWLIGETFRLKAELHASPFIAPLPPHQRRVFCFSARTISR